MPRPRAGSARQPSDGTRARLAAARAAHGRRSEGRRSQFALTLLGRPGLTFRTHGRDDVAVRFRVHRAFELVAFLALAPERWAGRKALVEALFGDEPGEVAERNFLPTVSDARRSLRRAAGTAFEPLVRDQGGYRLGPGVGWRADAVRLDHEARLVEALRTAHPDRALAIGRRAWRRYRGPLLEDVDRAWVESERERLTARYRRLLGTVGELALGRDRLGEAIDAYRTLMLDDPFEESVHLSLMEIYARQGRPDLVRRQFMRLEDALDELDVAPSETARSRYRVLVSSPGAARLDRDTMPAP